MSKNPGDNESSKEPRRRTTFCLTKSVNNKYPKLDRMQNNCRLVTVKINPAAGVGQGRSDEGIAGKWPHSPFDHKLACNK